MATYRFRVTFEDYDDVSRDIEIRSTQTFEDLHFAIQNAIGFDASKQTSFYLSDDNWKKGKEITTRELNDDENEKASQAKNSRLCDFIIDPHQKIYYVFDITAQWSFRIELVKINREEEPGASYPRCVKSNGEAPKQYNATNFATLPVPEDFDIAAEDDAEEGEEGEDLLVDESELPEEEEKSSFLKADLEGPEDDFETADEDSGEEEPQDKDDF